MLLYLFAVRIYQDFLKYYKEFKKKGIEEIFCVSVNDPFVLNAWGNKLKVKDKIKMLSDGNADLAQTIDYTIDIYSKGMGVRSDRYVLIVENGKVFNFIKDERGYLENTAAEAILAKL